MNLRIGIVLILLLVVSTMQRVYSFEEPFRNKLPQTKNSTVKNKQPDSHQKIIFHTLPPDFVYNEVRCILKDHIGYLWFGTANGLIRFDGINLNVYVHDQDSETSLNDNVVNTIAEDKNKNLWIGTSSGLNLYSREKDNFMSVDTADENINLLNCSYIKALYVNDDNCLWIGTFGFGLNAYDIENNVLNNYTHDLTDINSISSTRITCLISDTDNNLWIGTQNGLNVFHRKTERFTRFYNEPEDPLSLSCNHIIALEIDLYGNLWIGTQSGGLHRLIKGESDYFFERYTNKTQDTRLSSNFIRALYADDKGILWIGTDNGGLNHLNIKTKQVSILQTEEGNKFSINSNSIWSIFGDNEDRIWIGTYNKGINVIDENLLNFETYLRNSHSIMSLTDNDVTGFAEDRQGNVWVATDGGGICRFNVQSRQFNKIIKNTDDQKSLANNSVQAILYDSDDNIWIGTWGGGIDRLTKEGLQSVNYKVENEIGVGNNNVKTLCEDREGNIWAGTSGSGVFRYDKEADRFTLITCKNPENILSERAYITSIVNDSDTSLWIGTTGGLIHFFWQYNKLAEYSCYLYTSSNSGLNNNSIRVIFKDSNNNLWIGTAESGLVLFNKNDNTFRIFKHKEGFPGNSISGILEDAEGKLWISTNMGIFRFDYQKLSITKYTREDGLNSNEFYPKSCLRIKNGAFLFGGEEGFNIFYPDRIKTNRHIPKVLITEFRIDNVIVEIGASDSLLKRHISETKEIVLNYKQSSFSIDFVALNYTRPLKNQFLYKLEGFDKDWNYISSYGSANYTNILPGEYTFKVKGSNNDGLWNEIPTELSVIIKPPYWRTWWAYGIYVFTLLLVIAVSLKIWYERISIKNQLKLEKLAKEKEHELNELNIQFFTSISHEFRTPLSLIIGPLETLINSTKSKIREQLLVIQRNAGRLLHLTNNLMDLQKLEEGVIKLKIQYGDILEYIKKVSDYFSINFNRHKINFLIEIDETSITGWFDAEKLETILLNLLSNAIKYTPDRGTIRVKVNSFDSLEAGERYNKYIDTTQSEFRFLEVVVIDYGRGILPEELPFIFDKFYQADSGEMKKKSGTGIGLTLTKGLIEMHHGRIWVESYPNKKTLFTFILPIDRDAYNDEEIVNKPANALEREIILDEFESIQSSEENLAENDESIEKPEVLIVEDNDELRTFLAKELSIKFKVTQAEDGKEGIALVLKEIPDLIVSDVLMPHSSGIDLCKTVKSDVRTCHIPVILLTAKNTINDQIEGIETGADAYISKPFNIQFLLTQINHLIQSRRELYAHYSKEVYIIPNEVTNNKMDEMFLQKVIDYIIQNLTESKLSIEGLADYFNMSHSNMYRKIKALTGNTIIDFIRTIRLKQAVKLMETRKYSLSEISYLTGFTSPSYFTKTFREHYGKPPSDYLTN